MGQNIAARRAAKAQRRKTVVAQKRRADTLANSLGGRIHAAAKLPIQHCLLGDTLFTGGMATLVVARGATPHHVAMATFLLDGYGLGVKDTDFQECDRDRFKLIVDMVGTGHPLVAVEPSYARKLLHDLVRWSASHGFGPHEDYAVIERIFGDVRAEDCTEEFTFGHEGKPLLVPGPFDLFDEFEQDDELEDEAEPVQLEATAE